MGINENKWIINKKHWTNIFNLKILNAKLKSKKIDLWITQQMSQL